MIHTEAWTESSFVNRQPGGSLRGENNGRVHGREMVDRNHTKPRWEKRP